MPNPKLCAICGHRQATTRDHVPPKGMFPKPLPIAMITVPACRECNNGANLQDERFRLYLTAVSAEFNDKATELWRGATYRSLKKNERLMREFAGNINLAQPYAGQQEGIPLAWPVDAFRPVVERIVRGLYYHHFKDCMGVRTQCDVSMLNMPPEAFLLATANWMGGEVGGETFWYRFGRAGNRSFWVLRFFERVWACVESFPIGEAPLPVQ